MKQEIVVIVDRSGSMVSIRGDMEGGLRAFVDEQKKLGPAGFTLVRFDDQYEVALEGKPLDQVQPSDLGIDPRGMTALNDAIGKTVTAQGERFARMAADHKPERVALLVITDGLENASKEWTGERVKALLKQQQEQWKWAVTFLGAGIDAIDAASNLAISASAALSVGRSPQAIKSAFCAVSASVVGYRGTGELSAYSDADRASSK